MLARETTSKLRLKKARISATIAPTMPETRKLVEKKDAGKHHDRQHAVRNIVEKRLNEPISYLFSEQHHAHDAAGIGDERHHEAAEQHTFKRHRLSPSARSFRARHAGTGAIRLPCRRRSRE